MTSMVTGQLEDAISLHSILTAMFPWIDHWCA